MSRYHSLHISNIFQETNDSVVIEFDVPAELRDEYVFHPGQHIGVKTTVSGEDVRRSYSICAVPDDGVLRIGVKKVPGGRFSTHALEQLRIGDTLEVLTPQGNFTHQPLNGNPAQYVFFAAGSGITPVISLIRSILNKEPFSEILLFFGNQTSESIMFREELEALKNRFTSRFSIHHVISREAQSTALNTGRIDTEKCDTWSKVFFSLSEVNKFFLCGPEQMIMSVRDWLRAKGVDDQRIRFELFTTPTSKAIAEERTPKAHAGVDLATQSAVSVRVDGVTTEFPLSYGGKSILDAAMGAGADVPFSCKGGVCCTCKALLVEGEVDMDVVYGLEPDEIENGYILTCQSHPRTEKVMVDYDS